MRRAAAALALVAASAAAQETMSLPGHETELAELETFSRCRADVFHHLDSDADPASVAPRMLARTLPDRSNFIIAASLLDTSIADVEDGRTVARFIETRFIAFNGMIASERARLTVAAERDRVLLDCAPWMRSTIRSLIDHLVAWRPKPIDLPPQPDPAEIQRRFEAVNRRLGMET